MEQKIITYLKQLPVGAKGYIVGYDRIFRGYQGKLISMGLFPGTEFILVRQASSLYTPLLIEVRGNLIGLRPPEADALCIEESELLG